MLSPDQSVAAMGCDCIRSVVKRSVKVPEAASSAVLTAEDRHKGKTTRLQGRSALRVFALGGPILFSQQSPLLTGPAKA
jgi:hypothetical protein